MKLFNSSHTKETFISYVIVPRQQKQYCSKFNVTLKTMENIM